MPVQPPVKRLSSGLAAGRRPRRVGGNSMRAAVLLLAVGGLDATAAAAASVATRPDLPAFPDRVEVVVAVEGCAPSLGEPEVFGGTLIRLELHDACPPLPSFELRPFTLVSLLPPLAPGFYSVEVRNGQGVFATTALTMYGPSSVALELPDVAASDDPTPVRVVYHSSCASIDAAVDGQVIRIDYDFCPIEPPPPRLNTFEPPVGPLAPGNYEVRLFDHTLLTPPGGPPGLVRRTLRVRAAGRCLPGDTGLCLQDGRFRVEATWELDDGTTGVGHALQLDGSEESGRFWFFAADNSELTVKVLAGCPVNQRWWVFVSSSSTVEYRVTVTDTTTGAVRAYDHANGVIPDLVADTDAFGGCP